MTSHTSSNVTSRKDSSLASSPVPVPSLVPVVVYNDDDSDDSDARHADAQKGSEGWITSWEGGRMT